MASRSCVISVGAAIGVGSVPWNESAARRARVNWLPKATQAIGFCPKCSASITPDPVWYRFFHEIAETRMGGVNGQTIPQVASDVQTTQDTVVAVVDNVNAVNVYARSIDETTSALKEVAVNNGQAGSSTVPNPSEPPPRATVGTRLA